MSAQPCGCDPEVPYFCAEHPTCAFGKDVWQPITEPHMVYCFGKAQEEIAELQKVLARCLIQGVDGVDPLTKKSNWLALQEEIGDVRAALLLVEARTNLPRPHTSDMRMYAKLRKFSFWYAQLQATYERSKDSKDIMEA